MLCDEDGGSAAGAGARAGSWMWMWMLAVECWIWDRDLDCGCLRARKKFHTNWHKYQVLGRETLLALARRH